MKRALLAVLIMACGGMDPGGGTGGGTGGGGEGGAGGGDSSMAGGGAGGGDAGGMGGSGGGVSGTGGGTTGTGGGTAGTGGGTAGAGGGTAGTGGGAGGAGGAGGGAATVSFATQVAPIFRMRCGTSCHNGDYGSQNVNTIYNRLRGMTQAGTACASRPRLVVGDSANSLVVQKISGTHNCGVRMPIVGMSGCTGNACVSAAQIQTIRTWIDQGAVNN